MDLDLVSIESEVFLLGTWKNFEDLEDTLTLEELFEIATAINQKEHSNRRFAAALKGINLDDDNHVDIEERNINAPDIVGLNGALAEREGFGIGVGLGFENYE